MLVLDTSETRAGTLMPNIPGVSVSSILEALTGADVMVSAGEYPATTETLIRRHVEGGAFLIQRKSGFDLIGSLGDDLFESLGRMYAIARRPQQRILLFVGVLTESAGEVLIDGEVFQNRTDYFSVQGVLDKWVDRGGVVKFLPGEYLIPRWLKLQESHLREYADHPIKMVFGDAVQLTEIEPGDPLQTVRVVKDWRRTLVSLPGLGPELVQRVWEGTENLGQALLLLTDPDFAGVIPGIGEGKIAAIRRYAGLSDDKFITIAPLPEGDELRGLSDKLFNMRERVE